MQRSQSSGLMSSTLAVGPAMPALLTSTSSPPRACPASWNNRSTCVTCDTSARVVPTDGSSFRKADSASSSTSQMCTLAPCSTKVRAIARPIPDAPAVTTTRSPLAEYSMASSGLPSDNTGSRDTPAIRTRMAALIESAQEMLRPKPAKQARGAAATSIEHEELRGISRTVAEIHWLLLVLVLVYELFGGVREDAEAGAAVTAGLFFYAALVMSFRYANFYRRETRWKIAIETWGMIAFVTWVLWYTDALASPLLNAYLLPVITSALTLGKVTTLVNVGVIAACYVFLGGNDAAQE